MAIKEKELKVTINGKPYQFMIRPKVTLLELLRDYVGLTGARQGCLDNSCGVCTVMVDGKTVKSCGLLALQTNGRQVMTVEGLAGKNGELHPLQQAFIDRAAFQCGFCTPGKLMAARALLGENAAPTDEQIKRAFEGNICRCTGYVPMVEAVKDVSKKLQAKEIKL